MENINAIARKLLTILLVSSIAQVSFAQTDSSSEPDQPAANNSATIAPARERPTEEITVTEQLPVYRLRELTIEAEDKVYDLFNELVDEKRFRITCDTEKRINSLFDYRECKPEFEREATRAEAQDHLAMFRTMLGGPGELSSGSVSGGTAIPQQFSIPMQQKQLQKKMDTLARENPEFLQSIIEFVEAKQRLENYERFDDTDE
jgi:hypothetical protein